MTKGGKMVEKEVYMENYWFANVGELLVDGVSIVFSDRKAYDFFKENKDKITIAPQFRNPND